MLESQLYFPLMEQNRGSARGCTSIRTPKGKELLERYIAYAQQLTDRAAALYDGHFGGFFD